MNCIFFVPTENLNHRVVSSILAERYLPSNGTLRQRGRRISGCCTPGMDNLLKHTPPLEKEKMERFSATCNPFLPDTENEIHEIVWPCPDPIPIHYRGRQTGCSFNYGWPGGGWSEACIFFRKLSRGSDCLN